MKVAVTRFISFLFVGGLGFIVDLTVFSASVFLGGSEVAARATASCIAIAATWLLNRNITFKDRRGGGLRKEAAKYFSVSTVGATVNMVAFFIASCASKHIAVCYIAGTAAGLVANYTLYNFFVFRTSSRNIAAKSATEDAVNKTEN